MLLVIEGKPVSPEINTCITVERIIDVLTACKYCDCEDYLSTVECCRGNAYLERCDFLDKRGAETIVSYGDLDVTNRR